MHHRGEDLARAHVRLGAGGGLHRAHAARRLLAQFVVEADEQEVARLVGAHACDAFELVAQASALRLERFGLLPECGLAAVEVAGAGAQGLFAALEAFGAPLQRLLALLEAALDARCLLALLAEFVVDLLAVADGALLCVEFDLARTALGLLAHEVGGFARAAAHVTCGDAEDGVAEECAHDERYHAHEGAQHNCLHVGASIRDPRRRRSGSRMSVVVWPAAGTSLGASSRWTA